MKFVLLCIQSSLIIYHTLFLFSHYTAIWPIVVMAPYNYGGGSKSNVRFSVLLFWYAVFDIYPFSFIWWFPLLSTWTLTSQRSRPLYHNHWNQFLYRQHSNPMITDTDKVSLWKPMWFFFFFSTWTLNLLNSFNGLVHLQYFWLSIINFGDA